MGITVPDHVHARLTEIGQAAGITPAQAARILLTDVTTDEAPIPDLGLLEDDPEVEALLTRVPEGNDFEVAQLLTEGFSIPQVEDALNRTDPE